MNSIYVPLENDRAKLIPMTIENWLKLKEVASQDEDLLAYSPSNIYNEGELQAYATKALNGVHNGKRLPFIVFDKKTQVYAGSTSYGNYEPLHNRVEIGWTWIGKQFQGTGLNKNMKFLMLSHGFEKVGLKRIELKTDARNITSRKAMESLGCKYEGCLRSHTVMHDGYRRDTVYYSILENEWPEVKVKLMQRLGI